MTDQLSLEKRFVQANLNNRLTPEQVVAYNHHCFYTSRRIITTSFVGSFWRLSKGKPEELARIRFADFSLGREGFAILATSSQSDWLITHSPSTFTAPNGEQFFAHVPHFCDVGYHPIGREATWAVTLPVVFRCQGHPKQLREGQTTFTSLTDLDRITKA